MTEWSDYPRPRVHADDRTALMITARTETKLENEIKIDLTNHKSPGEHDK